MKQRRHSLFGHIRVPSAIQVGTGMTALSSKFTNTRQFSVSSLLQRPIPKVTRVTFWSLKMLYLKQTANKWWEKKSIWKSKFNNFLSGLSFKQSFLSLITKQKVKTFYGVLQKWKKKFLIVILYIVLSRNWKSF